MPRLKYVIASNAAKSANHIRQAITQSVTDFVSGADQSDDFTLVVVKRIAEG